MPTLRNTRLSGGSARSTRTTPVSPAKRQHSPSHHANDTKKSKTEKSSERRLSIRLNRCAADNESSKNDGHDAVPDVKGKGGKHGRTASGRTAAKDTSPKNATFSKKSRETPKAKKTPEKIQVQKQTRRQCARQLSETKREEKEKPSPSVNRKIILTKENNKEISFTPPPEVKGACPADQVDIESSSDEDISVQELSSGSEASNDESEVMAVSDSDSEVQITPRKEMHIDIAKEAGREAILLRNKVNNLELLLRDLQSSSKQHMEAMDEESIRLKNELKWKNEQLEEMNEVSKKNIELEAKLNLLLHDKEAYESEVEKKEKTFQSSKLQAEKEKASGKKKNDGETSVKKRSKRKKGGITVEDQEDIDALFVDDADNNKDSEKDIQSKVKDVEKTPKPPKEVIVIDDVPNKEDNSKDSMDKNVDGENETDSPGNTGRHNIRKLMGTGKLQSATVAAAKAEKERRDRAKKAHEGHEVVTEIDKKTKQPITTKLVLEFNKDSKKPRVELNSSLVRKLKPHQVEAVEFMWDNVVESVDHAEKDEEGSGCIVAHCMGLGKTLSVISIVHTLLNKKLLKMKTCLVICPLNTVLNWQYEWRKWLSKKDRLPVYELSGSKTHQERASALRKWQQKGGIMILGYQMFRILACYFGKSRKSKEAFDQCLLDPGADIVICDEGHMLKNDSSIISKSMNHIRTRRRIVLTGTPLQNNLIEYHCMVNFVKPNLLGTRREFSNRFVNPITNGQHSDSTAHDVKVMKRRAHVLHEMLAGFVQRRDYSALVKFLPPKYEYIMLVRLSEIQVKLYEKYLELNSLTEEGDLKGVSLFSDYQTLMRVWTHPWVLKLEALRQEKKGFTEDDDDELESLIFTSSDEEEIVLDDENSEDDPSSENHTSDVSGDVEVTIPKKTTRATRGSKTVKDVALDDKSSTVKEKLKVKLKPPSKSSQKTKSVGEKTDKSKTEDSTDTGVRRAKVIAGEVIRNWQSSYRGKGPEEELQRRTPPPPWWTEWVTESDEHKLELSGKLTLFFEILRLANSLGDKVLLFSQSLLSLDIIESFLGAHTEAERKKKTKKKSYKPVLYIKDEDYMRMDGSTGVAVRERLVNSFNDTKQKRLRLFLISTRAGGLGINLEAANRVIIFDASWNPSHDIQSIFRVYRFGQEKDVFVYRFLAQGTMEEKIYERQVTKETLSQRVVDEQQIDRHFTASDLKELYRFKPDRLDDPNRTPQPTPVIPKDVVLAELLSKQKKWIVGYHEHDSLLERRPEENLSEEERKAAWDDYEREKAGFYSYKATVPSMYMPPMSMLHRIPTTSTSMSTAVPPVFPKIQPVRILPPIPIRIPTGDNVPPKIAAQISQLPRVVQEIIKYNPNISADQLQGRLQAFLGMHSKYSLPQQTALNETTRIIHTPRMEVYTTPRPKIVQATGTKPSFVLEAPGNAPSNKVTNLTNPIRNSPTGK